MTLEVGVIGGGLIAQAIHLPLLCSRPERFRVRAIADPSRTVRDGLCAHWSIARGHADWRDLLDEGLDAVVVCSPNFTHAEVVLAALDQGLHVFVEKPLCLDPADASRICARQAGTGLVVQVGYMKRFDPVFARLADGVAAHGGSAVRLIDVVTFDPGMAREPFVPWAQMIHGRDVPDAVRSAGHESLLTQFGAAFAADDPEQARIYSDVYLGALSHDVNLIRGVLDRIGSGAGIAPVSAAHWNRGNAAAVVFELADGARWHSAWLLLPGMAEFREQATFHFDDGVHSVCLPAPYLARVPAEHMVRREFDGAPEAASAAVVGDAFGAELEHFAACVLDGVVCRTPAGQGAEDVRLLHAAFQLADGH